MAQANVAVETSPVALLIIDVINDLELPGGERIAEQLHGVPFHAVTLLVGAWFCGA